MKLNELKAITYDTWVFLHELEEAVLQPENFKAEVRRYGDLRRKSTWEKAYAALEAATLEYPALENWQMVQMCFCHPDRAELVHYNDLVLEAFLKFPDALDRIKDGLERLYYHPCEPSDQQDALLFVERLSQTQGLPQEALVLLALPKTLTDLPPAQWPYSYFNF